MKYIKNNYPLKKIKYISFKKNEKKIINKKKKIKKIILFKNIKIIKK